MFTIPTTYGPIQVGASQGAGIHGHDDNGH